MHVTYNDISRPESILHVNLEILSIYKFPDWWLWRKWEDRRWSGSLPAGVEKSGITWVCCSLVGILYFSHQLILYEDYTEYRPIDWCALWLGKEGIVTGYRQVKVSQLIIMYLVSYQWWGTSYFWFICKKIWYKCGFAYYNGLWPRLY